MGSGRKATLSKKIIDEIVKRDNVPIVEIIERGEQAVVEYGYVFQLQ